MADDPLAVPPSPELERLRALWRWLSPPGPQTAWLTQALLLRALAGIYGVAFSVALIQAPALIGEHGLLPATRFLARVRDAYGAAAYTKVPTIFWLSASDSALTLAAAAGLVLAVAGLVGLGNAPLFAVLWLLQLSFVGVGQTFWGFGWEILLLEAGFLAIFFAPALRPRVALVPRPDALGSTPAPPPGLVWLYRWVLLRLMLGAGLIKVRGDDCWRDFTCLATHYETQPIPSPVSPLLHRMPMWVHKLGVGFNHLTELVAPLFYFGPRRLRHVAAAMTVAFQLLLIVSGNLAFLNWLTLAATIACFDDGALARALPWRGLRERVAAASAHAASLRAQPHPWPRHLRRPRNWVSALLVLLVVVLSVKPACNLLSPGQIMNTSFDRLHLVNTYGAFGAVGKRRDELIIEGTLSATPESPTARWREYVFRCKPGPVDRRPCVITPYHLRLDWQIWFAPMSAPRYHPWLLHLIYKLLVADRAALSLLDSDPFGGRRPRFIRVTRYRYRFDSTGARWWKRRRLGAYLPPIARDTPALRRFLRTHKLID